jgi:hypothetical protein
MAHFAVLAPTTASSETLMRSDFLANSQSQLDVGSLRPREGQASIDGVSRCRPAARLDRARGEVEQAKAQEATLKKAIDEPAAGTNEADNQNENACMALIKAGEIPDPPRVPVPVSPQSQSLSKAKLSRPPFYCESAITSLVI